MGCAGVEPRGHAVARANVLHDPPLAPPDNHGAVGEVARLGRASDTAAIPCAPPAQDQRRLL